MKRPHPQILILEPEEIDSSLAREAMQSAAYVFVEHRGRVLSADKMLTPIKMREVVGDTPIAWIKP